MATTITIAGTQIRIDRDTGFICVTDIGNAKDPDWGKTHVTNWLSDPNTIGFIEAWELRRNPQFKNVDFDNIKRQAGSNTFYLSGKALADAGATGVLSKTGKYAGTYCVIDWSIHFASWLEPAFYVEIIDAFRRTTDRLYGREDLYRLFNRELGAENE